VEKTAECGAPSFLPLTKYGSVEKIEANKIGGSCDPYGGEKRNIRRILV